MGSIFEKHNIPHINSNFITIHVRRCKAWTRQDVQNPLNRIKLLGNNGSSGNATLDAVRTKLDKERVLSDVCVPSVLSFILLLSYLAQADLLGSAQYRAIDAVAAVHLKQSIFDTRAGNNVVSPRELDCVNNAIRNYMHWVEDVRCLSSFMKYGWFQAALVTPPMLELANGTFSQRYKYDRYVS